MARLLGVIYTVIWLLILIFISFNVAAFFALIYIFVLPFTICAEQLTGLAGVIYTILWLLILIFISFFIAFFFAWIYIICLPLTICIGPLQSLTDFCLKAMEFPKYCAQGMMDGKPLF